MIVVVLVYSPGEADAEHGEIRGKFAGISIVGVYKSNETAEAMISEHQEIDAEQDIKGREYVYMTESGRH